MTYLTFLLVFIVSTTLLVALWVGHPGRALNTKRAWIAAPLLSVIAFIYTTPWDNYLVFRRVWWYGQDRVLGTLFYVPYEEYAFFVLQPLMTGMILYAIIKRSSSIKHSSLQWQSVALRISITFWIYIAITVFGIIFILDGWDASLYMGLILAWAGPVLIGLWAYGYPLFVAYRKPFIVTLCLATGYLWVADRTAIALGIWAISDQYSFNLDPLGLPIEEAVFFLVTNLLVIQGTLLFLYGDKLASYRSHRYQSISAPTGG